MFEKRGVPTAVIGWDKLTETVGKVTARVHGMDNYTFAKIWNISEALDEKEVQEAVEAVLPQVEAILTGRL